MNAPAATKPAARRPGVLATVLLLGSLAAGGLQAGSLAVPNHSFESPVTPYANPPVDAWEKTAKPSWYEENGGFYWEQLVGTFRNPAPGYPDRIDNCTGQQALWVFAVPEVGLFQDYDSRDWNDPAPTHAFDIRYQTGHAYQLTVGLIGGGGAMLPGVTLALSLYYRDAGGSQVPVATQVIANSLELFPSATHFVDFSVGVPPVRASDPWAGRQLGIRILSTVSAELQGGYWDVDNVRLTETAAPELSNPTMSGSQLGFTLRSEPGQPCEILASPTPDLPTSNWASLAILTNHTGLTNVLIPVTDPRHQFYQARTRP